MSKCPWLPAEGLKSDDGCRKSHLLSSWLSSSYTLAAWCYMSPVWFNQIRWFQVSPSAGKVCCSSDCLKGHLERIDGSTNANEDEITSSISANCGHIYIINASIWNPWELLVSLKFAASVLGTASLSRRSEGAPLSRCPDQAFFGNAWQSWQLWVSDFLSPTNDLKCWDTNKQILINY